MSHHSRGGFTLIELLVVVVIIGMLVALLLPAIGAARESARRAECTNHQKELGTAVILYETRKGRFPGYLNSFGDNQPLSWVTVIFSDLGRADLWERWRDGNQGVDSDGDKIGDGYAFLKVLVCPSDAPVPTPGKAFVPLAYVANCGRLDDLDADRPDQPHNGVFHHQFYRQGTPGIRKTELADQVKMSASDIQDGTQQTLMLSEHLTKATWSDYMPVDGIRAELRLGFIWTTAQDKGQLDQMRIDSFDVQNNNPLPGDGVPHPGNVSSNHPGGVMVTFCDAHTQFLNQDCHYRVYQHLMTPDSNEAWKKAGEGVNVAGILTEGDY